jgi:DNA replication protein DnaC
MQRLLKESGLPEGKTLGNLDEQLLPVKVRRLLPTLLEGQFVEQGENVLVFGLPGRGKSHFLAAVGRELILRYRYAVLFQNSIRPRRFKSAKMTRFPQLSKLVQHRSP